MEQKIKKLDSGIIVSEVFVPTSTSSSEFILGPCFRDGFPPELEPFYALAEGEKLLLHSLQPGWHKRNTWRSWPTITQGWIDCRRGRHGELLVYMMPFSYPKSTYLVTTIFCILYYAFGPSQPVTKFYTFMVEDWPGEQCITLRRKFSKDECVKIEAMMIDGAITVPKANDENFGEDVRLHVSVLVTYGRVKVLSSWSSFVRPSQILQKFRKFTYSQATVLELSLIWGPMLRI